MILYYDSVYKATLVGIQVEVTEESYTNKANFLDLDEMPVYALNDEEEHIFSGRRVKCGLYRASGNRFINADVNGAYNILRKHRPDAFNAKGVADGGAMPYVVHPVKMILTKPRTVSDH